MSGEFRPGWPIDERKYLKLLRKHAKVKDYTIHFRVLAGGLWSLLDRLGVTRDELGMVNGGTREAQLERLAALIDTKPEEVAVICVYLGQQRYSDTHGHTQHPAPKVLTEAHQVALQVLDIRTRLVLNAAPPDPVVTDFNIGDYSSTPVKEPAND